MDGVGQSVVRQDSEFGIGIEIGVGGKSKNDGSLGYDERDKRGMRDRRRRLGISMRRSTRRTTGKQERRLKGTRVDRQRLKGKGKMASDGVSRFGGRGGGFGFGWGGAKEVNFVLRNSVPRERLFVAKDGSGFLALLDWQRLVGGGWAGRT